MVPVVMAKVLTLYCSSGTGETRMPLTENELLYYFDLLLGGE